MREGIKKNPEFISKVPLKASKRLERLKLGFSDHSIMVDYVSSLFHFVSLPDS